MTTEHSSKEEVFSVGEIAVAQHCRLEENNGKEVVILALPKAADWVTPDNTIVFAGHYWIRGPISKAQLLPFRLRKRGVSWADCAWHPHEVSA